LCTPSVDIGACIDMKIQKYNKLLVIWYSGIWNYHPTGKNFKENLTFDEVIKKQIYNVHVFTTM
jgi:hypothetical protein